MKNKGVIFLSLIILLVSIVLATHSTTISISPTSSYEMLIKQFNLNITNLDDGNIGNITNISIFLPQGFTINYIKPISGWNFINSSNMIQWYGGPIWSGGGIENRLKFNATINSINSDTIYNITINTTDDQINIYNNSAIFTVRNDSNPPTITSIIPSDYSFVKNDSTNIIINVSELETNIDYSSPFLVEYRDDKQWGEGGTTINSTTLNKIADNQFSNNINFNTAMDLINGYIFLNYRTSGLKDTAGNVYIETNTTHHLFVDTQNPSLLINYPQSQITINQYLQNLTFNISDDSFLANGQGLFTPNVTCSIKIDNNLNNSRVYTISINNTGLEVNLTGLQDGSHNWLIACLDRADYISSSTNNFILDTNGPSISLLAPSNSSVISNTTQININISDLYSGINSVIITGNGPLPISNVSSQYNFSIFNAIGGENIINIFANDSLNNINSTNFTFIVDNSTPILNLLTGSGSYSGTSSSISFTINDTYSNNLDCNLSIGNETRTMTTNNSGTFTFTNINLLNGTYIWNITCVDQADNRINSPNNYLNVDTISPIISLLEPQNNTNDDDGVISFNYSSSDVNGIANCSLYIDNIFVKNTSNILALSENISYTIAANNNIYNWNVSCYDNLGNLGSSNIIRNIYYDNIVPNPFNVTYTKTDSSATITWNVNEDANETLDYWIYPNTTTSKTISFSSSTNLRLKTIDGLSASTTYYFNISATDFFNNTNKSITYSFTTDATSSPSIGPGGGGGSCDPNWQTGLWSKCSINGIQTRTVTDLNDCGEDEEKPITSQSCIYLECKKDSDCLSGYECSSNKCIKKQETAEETPPAEGMGIGEGGITGFAILDNIKANPKTAAIIALGIIIIVLGSYYWLRSGDIPKEKVYQVIKEGKIKR